jgi:hypothetical protein
MKRTVDADVSPVGLHHKGAGGRRCDEVEPFD